MSSTEEATCSAEHDVDLEPWLLVIATHITSQVSTHADVAADTLHGSSVCRISECTRAVVRGRAVSGLGALAKVVESHRVGASRERASVH